VPRGEIIVLANSLKMRGRCVAGVSVRNGRWVRPVSEYEHGELYPSDFKADGWEPRPLDVVSFPYRRLEPEPAQPENLLIDRGPWRLVERLNVADAFSRLEPLLSVGPELLGNRDRGMPEEKAGAGIAASLALVEPEGLCFVVGQSFGKLTARACFELGGQSYDLPVTDRLLKPRLVSKERGRYGAVDLDLAGPRTLLTVSLGQPLNGTNWKLVAGCFAVA
jgi:hypothetical protein